MHRSEYLRSLLLSPLACSGTSSDGRRLLELNLTESAYPLLSYLYSGTLPPLRPAAPGDPLGSELATLVELLVCADMITLFHLKDLVQHALQTKLTVETATYCFAAADKLHAAQLRAAVVYFITQHYGAVKETPAFQLLPVTLRNELRRNLPTQRGDAVPLDAGPARGPNKGPDCRWQLRNMLV